MRSTLLTIGLLILSNAFMVLAWYVHLKFKDLKWLGGLGLFGVILISWGIAFFEYCFQVPPYPASGNNPKMSCSLAAQMPLSVIKPVTSRAGVTSKA